MKQEIIQFYANDKIHVPKMIMRRPAGITPEQVEAAAEQVYYQILQGSLKLKVISRVRHIWNVAKTINADAYLQDQVMLQGSKTVIENLHKRIDEKNLIIKDYSKKITTFYTKILIYASIAAALAVGSVALEILDALEVIEWVL